MAEQPQLNEYKISLRVKEEALQTFYLLHPAALADYGFFLRNALATDKYVVFQCARSPNRLFIAKSDDVSFLSVELEVQAHPAAEVFPGHPAKTDVTYSCVCNPGR